MSAGDRELVERARKASRFGKISQDHALLFAALADRLEQRAGWRAELVGYQEWLDDLAHGRLGVDEPIRKLAASDLARVTAMLSAAPPLSSQPDEET